MEKLLVYADFEWLNAPTLLGELTYESLRGTDSYGFYFAPQWLKAHNDLFLSADIQPFSGMQYTDAQRDIFACFADALPDRWGRTLLLRREQIAAREEGRPIRRLSSFDFLLGIDDASRLGALRFKLSEDGDFINASPHLRVPPMTELRTLIASCQAIERSEEQNVLPDKQWIAQLIQPGSSLGGARPKANVVDERGCLHIAKFPSRKDDIDAALWEHLCHLIAQRAGINTASTRVVSTGERHHTLLSQRFDRIENRRRHFASAMTAIGLQDGDNFANGYGYLDIVDFIVRHCTDVEQNLAELFRRVALNICIGNSDDHFRNHGFLLTPKGWTLSPAYDLTPSLNHHQSLLICSNSNEASLALLFQAAEEYMLTPQRASEIIVQVVNALHDWQILARKLGIANREIEIFTHRWMTSFQP